MLLRQVDQQRLHARPIHLDRRSALSSAWVCFRLDCNRDCEFECGVLKSLYITELIIDGHSERSYEIYLSESSTSDTNNKYQSLCLWSFGINVRLIVVPGDKYSQQICIAPLHYLSGLFPRTIPGKLGKPVVLNSDGRCVLLKQELKDFEFYGS
ncbi:unnamed protein product [Phytophthora lilii]|uniref:Unnamed protein product n=1 Tax=Phytophthora lilii TaxID=2077276 RepID=A0A9W6XN51_9STRA|nr:unnamed protein product [Phytophthora lilii]